MQQQCQPLAGCSEEPALGTRFAQQQRAGSRRVAVPRRMPAHMHACCGPRSPPRWVATDKSSGEPRVVRKVGAIVDTVGQQLQTVGI